MGNGRIFLFRPGRNKWFLGLWRPRSGLLLTAGPSGCLVALGLPYRIAFGGPAPTTVLAVVSRWLSGRYGYSSPREDGGD